MKDYAEGQAGAIQYAHQKGIIHRDIKPSNIEGMKKREPKIPPQGKIRLTEALERLVQFYDATGNKDKADEWRKKLAEVTPKKPEK